MWPRVLYLLQVTVKEVSPRLGSPHAYFLSSELQKYQKMLEPPPSAKPFTTDVDKKLEEGQKVNQLSLLPEFLPTAIYNTVSLDHVEDKMFSLHSWAMAISFSWLAFLILLLFK